MLLLTLALTLTLTFIMSLAMALPMSLTRYNVLLLDSDSMVLADPYPLVRRHLDGQGYTALCLHDITARQHGQSANGPINTNTNGEWLMDKGQKCQWPNRCRKRLAPSPCPGPTNQARPFMAVNGGTWYVRGASPEGPVQRVFAPAYQCHLP